MTISAAAMMIVKSVPPPRIARIAVSLIPGKSTAVVRMIDSITRTHVNHFEGRVIAGLDPDRGNVARQRARGDRGNVARGLAHVGGLVHRQLAHRVNQLELVRQQLLR